MGYLIKNTEPDDPSQWDADRVLMTLIQWQRSMDKQVYPEMTYFKNRADLFSVSKSNYLSEFEIKVSLADWKNDFKKGKFEAPDHYMPYVKYFYYVVPWYLVEKAPWDQIPDWVGVLGVNLKFKHDPYTPYIDTVYPVQHAKARKVKPVPTNVLEKWNSRLAYRYLDQQQRKLEEKRWKKLSSG